MRSAIREELCIVGNHRVRLTMGGEELSGDASFSENGVEDGSVVGVHVTPLSKKESRLLRNVGYRLTGDRAGCTFDVWRSGNEKINRQSRLINKSLIQWRAVAGLDTESADKLGAFGSLRDHCF